MTENAIETVSVEQASMLRRLRRLEGQIRGIERMVAEEKPCEEILVQIAAAKSAIDRAARAMISHRMHECLSRNQKDPESGVTEAMKMFEGFIKHYG